VGTTQGVVRAYSVKRREPEQRWDKEAIKGMVGTPQQPDPTKPGLKIPIRINFDTAEAGEPVPSELPKNEGPVRRNRMTPRALEKYGYTEGCPGCQCKKAGLDESRNHSEECRARIEAELDKEEAGREKLRKQAERINRWMADRGEHVEEEVMPEPPHEEPEEVEMEEPDAGSPEPKPEPPGEPAASEGAQAASEGEQREKRRKTEETEEERATKKPKETQRGGIVRRDERLEEPEVKRRRENTRIEDIMLSQLRKWRKS